MPTFRGNVGNLLQHWVLCEVLAASGKYHEQILFVDAYSMAPLANERPKRDGTAHLFDCVRHRLPGEKTTYEEAWHRSGVALSGYPNSAALLTAVWKGRYSLVLCEWDQATVQHLELWANERKQSPNCIDVEVAAGDWRNRFRRPLPGLGALTFFSFDPDMFDRHGAGRNPRNMDPQDFERLVEAFQPIPGRILVQLSTYSANNGNGQSEVSKVVTDHLGRAGLQLMAKVRTDGQMMSLVLGRDIEFASMISPLPALFDSWLGRVRAKCQNQSSGAHADGPSQA